MVSSHLFSARRRELPIAWAIAITALAVFFVSALSAVRQAQAQDPAEMNAVDTAIADVVASVKTEVPEEVTVDLDVRPEDLGVKDPRILPGSRLYGFKKIWRGVRLLVTRDPVKEAELRMKYANEKLMEAKKLAIEGGAGAAGAVSATLDDAQEDMEAIAHDAANLRSAKDRSGAAVDRFLEKVADRTMKHRRILDDVESRMPEAVQEHIVDVKQRIMGHVGDVVGAVDDPAALAQRFERAMDSQRGSDFKHFKNLEVLKELEAKVPEEARAAIAHAQEQARKHLTDALGQSAEQREHFVQYVQKLPGDAVRHFEVLDDVRSSEDLDPAFLKKIDAMKARAAERFNAEFEQRSAEARDRMLNAFRDADVGSLRTAEQLKHFVPPEAREEIEKVEAAQFDSFRAKFSGDPKAMETANLAQDLMRKMRENPDAVDFAVIQKLEERLTPEQKVFVQKMQQEGANRFRERFEAERDVYLERFTDPNAPRSLEVLDALRGKLPPEALHGIDRAIEVQKRNFEEHMNRLEDQKTLGHLKEAIELDSELKASFESGDPEFFRRVGEKQEELMRNGMEKRREIEMKVRPLFENPDAAIPDDIPAELRQKIEEQRRFIRDVETRHREEFEGEFRGEIEGEFRGEFLDARPVAPGVVPTPIPASPVAPKPFFAPGTPKVLPHDFPFEVPGAVRAPGPNPDEERRVDAFLEEKLRAYEEQRGQERAREEFERKRAIEDAQAHRAEPSSEGGDESFFRDVMPPVFRMDTKQESQQREQFEQRGGFLTPPFPAAPAPAPPIEQRGDGLDPGAPVEKPLGVFNAPLRSVIAFLIP